MPRTVMSGENFANFTLILQPVDFACVESTGCFSRREKSVTYAWSKQQGFLASMPSLIAFQRMSDARLGNMASREGADQTIHRSVPMDSRAPATQRERGFRA